MRVRVEYPDQSERSDGLPKPDGRKETCWVGESNVGRRANKRNHPRRAVDKNPEVVDRSGAVGSQMRIR